MLCENAWENPGVIKIYILKKPLNICGAKILIGNILRLILVWTLAEDQLTSSIFQRVYVENIL